MLVRTLGPEGGWIWWESHIDRRKERVSARTLGPEESGFGGCPTSIEEKNECQQGRWALKGGGL